MAFATAAHWVDRLAEAHGGGRLHAELTRLGRYPLIIIGGVGCIPFEAEAAKLFFQLAHHGSGQGPELAQHLEVAAEDVMGGSSTPR